MDVMKLTPAQKRALRQANAAAAAERQAIEDAAPIVPDTKISEEPPTMAELAQQMRASFQAVVTQKASETEAVEDAVRAMVADLDRQRISVIKRLMGIDTSWADVRIANDSNLQHYVTEEAQEIVRGWVAEATAELFTEENKKKFKTEFKRVVRNSMKEYIRPRYETGRMAEEIVQDLAYSAVNELRTELELPPKTPDRRR